MDSCSQSSGFDLDILNQLEDDLQLEIKNPSYQPFSPVRDAQSCVEASDSPSPDLLQDAYDGDDNVKRPQEINAHFDSDVVTSFPHLASSDIFSNMNKESDGRPRSLPDILKSFPLNPDKVDSGSSEGSPDLSPAHRRRSDSPNCLISVSDINPSGFDSKILLLKEMAEDTEARASEKAKLHPEKISEQSFVDFDLVKETDVHPDSEQIMTDKDSEESFQTNSVKFECLHFPTGKDPKHLDSESHSAYYFSTGLNAMAKRPVYCEIPDLMEEMEDLDEISEQEVSSEEFEFVERPLRSHTDEFLEMQDNSTFYEEQSHGQEPSSVRETEDQNSIHHLSQSDEPLQVKMSLESNFQASKIYIPVDQSGLEKSEVKRLSSLRAAAVMDLVYWRDVRRSAVVFSFSLLLLLSLSYCSVVSVTAYTALALLSLTVSFRIYKAILQAVQKSDEGHPFKQYLDKDIAMSMDDVHKYSVVALSQIKSGLITLRRLYLVEDLVDSLKFAVLLWILTYVGAVFNGLTLVVLSLVGVFSCPVIYEKHQVEIDEYFSLVKKQMKDFFGKVQAKVPGMKKLE